MSLKIEDYEYRWAHKDGKLGMISVYEAEYFGYEKFYEHLNYPGTWMMRRNASS